MVPLDRPSDPIKAPVSQERRNDFRRAFFLLAAKRHCRGHALSCFLDDSTDLIPRQARLRNAGTPPHANLVVNSSFRYEPHGAVPPDISNRPPPMDGLQQGFPLVWVETPGVGIWVPFSVRGEWSAISESLKAGQPAPSTLSAQARQRLMMAGVLGASGYEERERAKWEMTCREAGVQFRTYGYSLVRDVIPPMLIGALRAYYRALVAGGRLPLGDSQVAERHRLHSEPVGMFFHPQLSSLVSRIAGEPVKPSYVYFSSYPSGSALPRHVDRLQCEFSISLLVDYVPDPDGPCGWPLFLEHPDLPGGVVDADLGLGDVLLYRGRQLVHYRDPLPDGHQSSSIFLHYVRESFDGDTS